MYSFHNRVQILFISPNTDEKVVIKFDAVPFVNYSGVLFYAYFSFQCKQGSLPVSITQGMSDLNCLLWAGLLKLSPDIDGNRSCNLLLLIPAGFPAAERDFENPVSYLPLLHRGYRLRLS
jgi:hypothetical protein